MGKIVCAVALIAGALVISSCKSSNAVTMAAGNGPREAGASSEVLGWIDNNTFRVKAHGMPGSTEGSVSECREKSREQAIRQAQTTVIEKFVRDRVKRAEVVLDPRSTGVAITNEFGKSVKNGSIVHEKYDVNNNVEIIYQVTAPDLKLKVEARRRQ